MANINESKKHHFIYKTTNLLNGEYYVGMHSTSNLKDGYLGSGTRLRRAIRKHDKSNFKCEILEYYNTREELAKREKELVNDDLMKDLNCMNLKTGGVGGAHMAATRGFKEKLKDPVFKEKFSKTCSERNKKLYESGTRKPTVPNWIGRKHREETKKKIGLANALKQKGVLNSQYGVRYITNGVEIRKITKDDPVPEGWVRGKKVK
jgi:group I intron endonuclease